MSSYRVCLLSPDTREIVENIKFDNKEDAEHYAKNHSASDVKHVYEVQKNDDGDFGAIKSYFKGQEDDGIS